MRNAYSVVSLLALGLFAAGAAIAEAQTTTASSSQATSTAATSSPATTAIPEQTQPAPAGRSTRGSLTAAQQQRVINLAANISNQLETTIRRLQTITQRMQIRSDRIATAGGDVTTANAAIRATDDHISEARRALTTIDQDVYTVATSPNPADTWAPVKATYQRAQLRLINAQSSAEEALTALRAARP